jgi:hypothetical protein
MSKRQKRPHLHPTRKWWAAQITALTALVTAWVNAGTWNKPLTVAAIGLVSQGVIAYIVPNGDVVSRQRRAEPRPEQDATLARPTPAPA